MTHPWLNGVPITVTLDSNGIPTQFLWRKQRYQIMSIVECWEVETDWWSADGVVWQMYFAVFTKPKMFCVIRHDRQQEQWQYFRLYD